MSSYEKLDQYVSLRFVDILSVVSIWRYVYGHLSILFVSLVMPYHRHHLRLEDITATVCSDVFSDEYSC
jgi:hypothetical protein